ncbi:MAG: LicD family protein [Ruminococcus sp.]|nr:LicD family protein [Ruminococcus sp.]
MTELQKCEFDILKIFIDICDRLKLKYFLVCGSALGAVKYKGFIPWDDDIDVALLRPDYELFLKEAPKLLPKNIFLQNYKSDKKFPTIYSKLRNSDTTYIETSSAKLPINHGIYIDIFPLDGYPEKKLKQNIFEIRKTIYKRLLSVAYQPNKSWKWFFIAPFRLFGINRFSNKIAKSYEKMISKYSIYKTKLLTNHGNWQGKLDYSPVEHFGDGSEGIFEGLNVRLPYNYDAYLKQKYDCYEDDLPDSKKVGHHFYTKMDCNKSYKEYVK